MNDSLQSINRDDIALLVASNDLYEEAWNPFFRLLEKNWDSVPKNIYLSTESKKYKDPYFDVVCLNDAKGVKWGKRIKNALKRIDEKYVIFFLEDFFIRSRVNDLIFNEAVKTIMADNEIGAIKFVPRVSQNWFDGNQIIDKYFAPIPINFRIRNACMITLFEKNYFLKLIREYESPWEFETFGSFRSRKIKKSILIQTNEFPLAFEYDYQIKYGYGISKKRWLKNNKQLFEENNIEVNFDNLGWYEEEPKEKIVGLKRTIKEKLSMPFTNPSLFFKIVIIEIKRILFFIKHIRNMF